jgi:BioD-like phosphotransacetylase family protein
MLAVATLGQKQTAVATPTGQPTMATDHTTTQTALQAKTITVTVSWRDPMGITHHVPLRTIISR